MIETQPETPHWFDAYVIELRRHGLERTAAAAVGTTTRQVKKWRDDNAEFDIACREAEEEAADRLELEARRRALEGIERGVFYQGERVDSQIEYSDTLLTMLLKGRRERVFGDKRRITGGDGEPLTIRVTAFPLPDDNHTVTHTGEHTQVAQARLLGNVVDSFADDLA
jgi:hypothetical protein